MIDNIKILIGIPTLLEYPKFFESLSKFVKEIDGYYNYDIKFVYKKHLSIAHYEILEHFLKGDYTHLLLLEDDHLGHSKSMLDALIKPDVDVCCINTYAHQYPYNSVLRDNDYNPIICKSGYAECGIIGLGMTLYKRSALVEIKIDKYDRYLPHRKLVFQNNHLTFLGCWDYTLQHRNITKENVESIRNNKMIEINQKERDRFIEKTLCNIIRIKHEKLNKGGNNVNEFSSRYATVCR